MFNPDEPLDPDERDMFDHPNPDSDPGRYHPDVKVTRTSTGGEIIDLTALIANNGYAVAEAEFEKILNGREEDDDEFPEPTEADYVRRARMADDLGVPEPSWDELEEAGEQEAREAGFADAGEEDG